MARHRRRSPSAGHLSDIGHEVERYVRSQGRYGIPQEYGGHGIGTEMHMDPWVANHGKPGPRAACCEPGMCLAVEPMVNLGTDRTRVLADDWTVVTVDGKPSAHFEHSVAVTHNGPWVLTALDGGRSAWRQSEQRAGSGWADGVRAAEMRASDGDRDKVAAVLREHYRAGPLTVEEFDERLEQLYTEQDYGELAAAHRRPARRGPASARPTPHPPLRARRTPRRASGEPPGLQAAWAAWAVGERHQLGDLVHRRRDRRRLPLSVAAVGDGSVGSDAAGHARLRQRASAGTNP